MNQLNFNVNGNLLTLNNKPMVTSGSVNYDACTFNFNKDWRGFSKTAVFTMEDDETCCVSLDNTSTCKIPSECLTKRGILKIGVVGEKDDSTVISTNLVAHRVVQGANEESLEFPDDIEIEEPVIPTAESKSNIAFWEDERLTLSKSIVADDYSDVDNTDINSYYDVTFSRLARLYPDYVTRAYDVEDSTGNRIEYFTFASENYDRTILVTANHFAYNLATFKALSKFFKELCGNFESNSALRFLHNKVKIVVMPIMSPQAVMNGSRLNDNGVAPFVNYDNLWDDSPIEDKGESAFSEMETIAYLSTIETLLEENLIWAFDFESQILNSNTKKIYYKSNYAVDINFLNQAVNKYNSGYRTGSSVRNSEYYESQTPIATNYANLAYGVNACTVIWSFSGELVNEYADFIGNMLYEIAYNSSTLKKASLMPIVKHIAWRGVFSNNDYYSTTTSMTPLWISAFKQRVLGVYNVRMSGYVLVEAEKNTKFRVKPVLMQNNTQSENYDLRFNNDDFDVEVTTNVGVTAVPFETVMRCHYSNGLNTSNASLLHSFIATASQSSVKVIGFSYTVSLTPSDEMNSVEVLSPTGKIADYSDLNNTPFFTSKYPEWFNDII